MDSNVDCKVDLKVAKRIVAANDGNIDLRVFAQAMAREEMAESLNAQGRYSEALLQIMLALSVRPADPFFLDTLAQSLYGLGRYLDAITASNAALRAANGKYAWIHFHLGMSYSALEDWNKAKESYERAVQLDPAEPAYNVAASLVNSGFKREAIGWYREVISRDAAYASKHEVPGTIADLERYLQ